MEELRRNAVSTHAVPLEVAPKWTRTAGNAGTSIDCMREKLVPASIRIARDRPTRNGGPAWVIGVTLQSLRKRLVEDDDQADDFVSANRKIVRENEFVRQVRLVICAVIAALDDDVPVVVDHVKNFDGDMIAHDFLVDPFSDGRDAVEDVAVVVDVSVVGKCRDDPVCIECVDGGDVLGDDDWEFG